MVDKLDPKNISPADLPLAPLAPIPGTSPASPPLSAKESPEAKPDVAAFQRLAGRSGRVGGIVGRSVTPRVKVAGVEDTVAGHLERTLDEMPAPSLMALQQLLEQVVLS
jgi:hypothetical protein